MKYCVSKTDGTIQGLQLLYNGYKTPMIGTVSAINSKCKQINARDDCIGSVVMHEHLGKVELIEFSYRKSGYFFKVGNWT